MKNLKETWKTDKYFLILGIIFFLTSISFNDGIPKINLWYFIPAILILLTAFLKEGLIQWGVFVITIYFWGIAIILETNYNNIFRNEIIFLAIIIVTIIYINKIIKHFKNKKNK